MENTNKNTGNDDAVTLIDFSQDIDPSEPVFSTENILQAAVDYPELAPVPEPEALPAPEPVSDLPLPEVLVVPATPVTEENSIPSLTAGQLGLIKTLLVKIEEHTKQINDLIYPYLNNQDYKIRISQSTVETKTEISAQDVEVIEGVFDGEQMVGPDGQRYNVPANYASKSRLVEGDMMKLTITANGTFIYKQIEPIERRRLTGVLEETETGEYLVMTEDRRWHVLAASVSYYKGEAGDQVTIVIPKQGLSKWAAIENIVKR